MNKKTKIKQMQSQSELNTCGLQQVLNEEDIISYIVSSNIYTHD